MKKVLVENCTLQQARIDIKTKPKPVNKPKSKIAKGTVSSVPDTADIENDYHMITATTAPPTIGKSQEVESL